jgi:Domain of unknown function (DUF5134)
MGGPAWLTATFAVLMITVAAYCAGRLAVAGRWRRLTELDTDAGHVLMGVAMAGVLVTRLRILPAATWEAVFAAAAAWFAWRLLQPLRPGRRRAPAAAPWRSPHPAPHLVECAAMLYMFLVLPPSLAGHATAAAMGGMATAATASRFSFLALLMVLFMFGYVVRVADRLPIRPSVLARVPAGPVPLAASAGATAAASAGGAPAPEDTPAPAATRPGRPYLAPRCAALCKIAMGITMGYMLILML